MGMKKEIRGDFDLWFDPDDLDVPAFQYNRTNRIFLNKWGTIKIELTPGANVDEVARKAEIFEKSVAGDLA